MKMLVNSFTKNSKNKKKESDPAFVLVKLIDLSLQKGSKDNMSALMVIFEDGSDYNQKDEFIAGPFNPHKNDEAFRNAYLADAKRCGYQGEELMDMAKKAEEAMKLQPAPPLPDPQGPNMMLKSLIQSLASNLGGLPGENREEKAMALMAFLQGGHFDVNDNDGDVPMKTETNNVTPGTSEIEQNNMESTTTTTQTTESTNTDLSSNPSSPASPNTSSKKKKKKKKKKNTNV